MIERGSEHRTNGWSGRLAAGSLWALFLLVPPGAAADPARQDSCGIPLEGRGDYRWERTGMHDAANIRTEFHNYGMVGGYPQDPIGVDLSTFHSAEVPRGSGMNYTDGITPFVLAKVRTTEGLDAYIMETGYRERQALSSRPGELMMRFEPRRGYFQEDPRINSAQSPAVSNDPRTWPDSWPDRDATWDRAWNGYFGKRPAADQESFSVMDDDYYDAFDFYPDSNCLSRRGLGLRIEVRGFQWSNPQAGNVIFWHYDITNEGTTPYDDDIIFGLYMDSGVGGSTISCDRIAESDDDNAFFDRSMGLNLVYTWDKFGHGTDLQSDCSPTGYLGYAYLETPGNPFDGVDNDLDGFTDERRDGGPGERIEGQAAIRAYVAAHYDQDRYESYYGPLANRPAYKVGVWWTGDEDMDWVAEFNDTGRDGVFGSADPGADGEGDGTPTAGEPNFDQTDINESDQIGLTGFKMNRIKAGEGSPSNQVDDIVFFTNQYAWPQRLYEMFANPDSSARFDQALVQNYNIGFLFASGPFKLQPGRRERFSLALAYGADLSELRQNVRVVQQIYDANYQFAVPPPRPTLAAEVGDGRVRLSWDDVAERGFDPVSGLNDFEGYRIYRATDAEFRDPRVLTSGRGNPLSSNGKPIAQFDLRDGQRGYSRTKVDGVSYWLGEDTGLTHTWTDSTVTNGQDYYYAVCAYDYGSPASVPDTLAFYPSENSIPISRTPRGGLILPTNAVRVRPNPRVPGFVSAIVDTATRIAGRGVGSVRVRVANSDLVPDEHLFKLAFLAPSPDSIHATTYVLLDSTVRAAALAAGDTTASDTLFKSGRDFEGLGEGPIGAGLLPVVQTPEKVLVDTDRSGFRPGAGTDASIQTRYVSDSKSPNLRRPGYPVDVSIVFYDTVADTGLRLNPFSAQPAKFRVFAHADTGWQQMDFMFWDDTTTTRGVHRDSTLADSLDVLVVLDYSQARPNQLDALWQFGLPVPPGIKPAAGDTFDLRVIEPFGAADAFVFGSRGALVNGARAVAEFAQKPYVVPNPYVGSASFEPARYAIQGRGERRLEFRAIPQGSIIRIFTVSGHLVRTLRQDGSDMGYVPWDLRTKDNLDVAPGLYIFHVEAPGVGTSTGKFAVIK